MYGGDLKVQSLARETTRDVAVRRRQMAIVDMIEEYCKLNLILTNLIEYCIYTVSLPSVQLNFRQQHLAIISLRDG